MERARNGDAGAFGELYARYRDAIYRYVAFRVADARDAEDLTGHVFLRAWESLPRYEPRGYRFTSWLYRIAHNLVADHHRGRGAFVAAPLEEGTEAVEEQGPTTLERVIAAEEAATLTRAVQRLPADQREVVLLRFVHGLSHTDIARRMAKSQGASRVILHRALATLNQMLRSSLVAVLAVLLLIGGVVYAARNAQQGEPLYVVRTVIEQVQQQALPPPAPILPTALPTDTPTGTAMPTATTTQTPTRPPQPSSTTAPVAQVVVAPTSTAMPSAPPSTSTAPAATPAPASPSPGSRLPEATVGAAPQRALSTETAAPTGTSVACCTATPTVTASPAPSQTPTPSATASATPSQTPTPTSTSAPADTPTSTPIAPTDTSTPQPCCDATPEPTHDDARLLLAIAVPSRPVIYGGETLTASVVLVHRGENEGAGRVVLVLPEELRYVEGSAEYGGTYEAATHSVVWRAAQIPARATVRLGVQLTAREVREARVVRLVARVRVGELVAEREVPLALMPKPRP